MNRLTLEGTTRNIYLNNDTITELFTLVDSEMFNSLFLYWYHDQSEYNFKEFKQVIKEHFVGTNVKVCIKDYSGINLPCIKIKVDNYKIVARIGFNISITVKEC